MKFSKILLVFTATCTIVGARSTPVTKPNGMHEGTSARQLFSEIIDMFKDNVNTETPSIDKDLERVKNIEILDKEEKKSVSSLVKKITHLRKDIDKTVKGNWFKKHYRAKSLSRFVDIYIHHELNKSSNTPIMKLTKTVCALKAQIETMKMVRQAKMIDLLVYIAESFEKHGLIEYPDTENVDPLVNLPDDQNYFFDTIVVFVKSIAFVLFCTTINLAPCLLGLTGLLAVQLVLWITITIRMLIESIV